MYVQPSKTEYCGSMFKCTKKYKIKAQFKKHSSGAFNYANRNGIFEEACAHMASPQENSLSKKTASSAFSRINRIWTHESVRIEALKYGTRTNFKRESRSAYNYAHKHKIYNDICAHMPSLRCNYSVSTAQKKDLPHD
jgi:hypothetical protein